MSEKNISCSRCIENFNPAGIATELVHEVWESVADAFLSQIEYGKDYVISTDLVKEDWAHGLGTKYTHTIRFDDLVRCKDCKHWATESRFTGGCTGKKLDPNGFCSWGERRQS